MISRKHKKFTLFADDVKALGKIQIVEDCALTQLWVFQRQFRPKQIAAMSS